MTILDVRLPPGAVEPAYLHIPDAVYTDGDQVAGLAEDAHYAPDPEQRLAVDAIFAKNAKGKSAAFETHLIVPRQNMKTGTEKIAVLGWAFLFREDPIIWTAHEWDPTIKEAFTDLEELIGGYRWLARQVRWMHRGDRSQEIALRNGSRILFKTRTPGGGRGLAGAKTILDEHWATKAAHMGALVPTMAARSITGDPQILGGSSAARATSEVLHGVMRRGRLAATDPVAAAREPRLCYIEYRAPDPATACDRGEQCSHDLDVPGCGCDKPELIKMANPAVDRRIDLDFIMLSERRSMPPAEFGRERMGWEDEPEGHTDVIPVTDWASGQDPKSEPASPVCLSVVYFGNKRQAAIGLAGKRADRNWHVEVADILPVAQVVARVGEIIARAESGTRPVCGVVVDPHGYEGACIMALEAIEHVTLPEDPENPISIRLVPYKADDPDWWQGRWASLMKPTATDVAAAYTGFLSAVTETRDLYHRGQDDLTLALAGATARTIGDAGEAWGRRKSGVEIAALVAVTEARWGWEKMSPVMDYEPGVWFI